MKRKPRARGRTFSCACGEERLRDSREAAGLRRGAFTFLFGECGGGVRFRRQRGVPVDVTPVGREEIDRVRALPAVIERGDRECTLESLAAEIPTEDSRREFLGRSQRIVTALRVGVASWVEAGALLAQARPGYDYRTGFFASWLAAMRIEPHQAARLMAIGTRALQAPQLFERLKAENPNLEVAYLLSRLPQGALAEFIERGVPLNGGRIPIAVVRVRVLRAKVYELVGRDPRGRKPAMKPAGKAVPPPKPTHRFGLPIEIVTAFQKVHAGLTALKRLSKQRAWDGLDARQRRVARRLWGTVGSLYCELDQQSGWDLTTWLEDDPQPGAVPTAR